MDEGHSSCSPDAETQATSIGSHKSKRGKRPGKACLPCRRAKRQCQKDEADSTRCKRCKASKIECVYAGLEGPDQVRLEMLERQLERQLAEMQTLKSSLDAVATAEPRPTYGYPLPVYNSAPSIANNSGASTSTSQWIAQSAAAPMLPTSAISAPTPYSAGSGGDQTQEHDTFYVSDTSPFNAPYAVIADAAGQVGDSGNVTRANSPQGSSFQRPRKRRRLAQNQSPPSTYKDVIARGEMTDSAARSRFRMWMDLCREYVPVLDPARDTFEALLQTSPLTFDAVIASAMKTEDPEPDNASRIFDHALREAGAGLFASTTTLQEIQALAILATWHSHAYVLVGYAMRIAHNLRLYLSVDQLNAAFNEDSVSSHVEEERNEQAELLSMARLFAHLWFMDISQSTMRNQPICTYGSETNFLSKFHQILNHPAAICSDIRTAAMLENAILRRQVLNARKPPRDDGTDEVFKSTQFMLERVEKWYTTWDKRIFLPAISFPRCSLRRTAANTRLMVVCHCLDYVLHRSAPIHLSENERRLLNIGQTAAEESISIATTCSAYTSTWKQAGHPTHIDFAFSGIIALRLANLLQNPEDSARICRIVEALLRLFERQGDSHGCLKALRRAYARVKRSHDEAMVMSFFSDQAISATKQDSIASHQEASHALFQNTSTGLQADFPTVPFAQDGHDHTANSSNTYDTEFWDQMLKNFELDFGGGLEQVDVSDSSAAPSMQNVYAFSGQSPSGEVLPRDCSDSTFTLLDTWSSW